MGGSFAERYSPDGYIFGKLHISSVSDGSDTSTPAHELFHSISYRGTYWAYAKKYHYCSHDEEQTDMVGVAIEEGIAAMLGFTIYNNLANSEGSRPTGRVWVDDNHPRFLLSDSLHIGGSCKALNDPSYQISRTYGLQDFYAFISYFLSCFCNDLETCCGTFPIVDNMAIGDGLAFVWDLMQAYSFSLKSDQTIPPYGSFLLTTDNFLQTYEGFSSRNMSLSDVYFEYAKSMAYTREWNVRSEAPPYILDRELFIDNAIIELELQELTPLAINIQPYSTIAITISSESINSTGNLVLSFNDNESEVPINRNGLRIQIYQEKDGNGEQFISNAFEVLPVDEKTASCLIPCFGVNESNYANSITILIANTSFDENASIQILATFEAGEDKDGDGFGSACGGGDCDDNTSDDPQDIICPSDPSDCSSTTSACAICIYPNAQETFNDRFVLEFDGEDDFVKTELYYDPLSLSSGLTISAWVYPFPQSHYKHQIVSSDNGKFDWSIVMEYNFWRVFTGENCRDTEFPIEFDAWQHLAAVFEPEIGIRFYMNGKEVIIPYIHSDSNTSTVHIGRNPGGWGEYFNGFIREVRIWDTARSKNEIVNDMNKQLSGNELNLIGYWRLDDGLGQTVKDYSPNANDGKLGGTLNAEDTDPVWKAYDGVDNDCDSCIDEKNICKKPWKASNILEDCEGPQDELNTYWYENSFDDLEWESIVLPDVNSWGDDFVDRFYRLHFTVNSVEQLIKIWFASDDGLWVYVNGEFVGNWGNSCHVGGCVNDPLGHCLEFDEVPAVDITSFLQVGRNVIATHVTDVQHEEYFNLEFTE